MNMNKMQVNEEANQPQKRSDEAEKSYLLNSNAEKLSQDNPELEVVKVNLDTGSFTSNSIGSIPDFSSHASISSYPDLIYNPYDQSYFSVNQNQTENGLLLSRSFGFYSSNCLHDQRPEEQEFFQKNPTYQTSGFYEQYDQTKTEDRNQILANTWRDWESNAEDFSPSMQSGFWVENTYYQRWSTNSGTF